MPALATAGVPVPVPEDLLPDPEQQPTKWVTLDILTPLHGSEVGGKLLIEGRAVPERGYAVRYVYVYLDNVYMGQAAGTEDWTFALDTRTLIDGNHTFSATAIAHPKATPLFVLSFSNGENAKFRTLNHQKGVTLFDKTIDLAGAAATAWTIPIDKDHTGLRVTLEGADGRRGLLDGPRGQLLLAYKDTPESPSTRTWLLAYGLVGGGGFISKPPHGVLKAPGVLVLTGAFAG